jgi:hypothetical protein
MTESKQKRQLVILSGLFVILLGSLYYALRGTGVPAEAPVSTAAPSPKVFDNTADLTIERARRFGKKTISLADADPTIHLVKLNQFTPGAPLNTRNMFSMEASPPPVKAGRIPTSRQGPAGALVPTPAATGEQIASVPPGSPLTAVNLKFYGIKIDPASKGLQGFFTEGNEMYLAGEGDLVANRYRVLKIGDSSAEIEDLNSKSRRQLPMSTQ